MSKGSSARAERVLIVDDVEDNREMYAEYLRFQGFVVETASTAEDALEKAERHPPQLIVMDIALPGIDGWEAIRQLRANPRTRDGRVLIVSGHSTPELHLRAQREGVTLCVKPVLPDDLLEKLESLLPRLPPPVAGTE